MKSITLKKTSTNELSTRIVLVPLHQLKLMLTNGQGDPLIESSPPNEVNSRRFVVDGPGLEHNLIVKSVKLPTLDYDTNDTLLAEVEIYELEDGSEQPAHISLANCNVGVIPDFLHTPILIA